MKLFFKYLKFKKNILLLYVIFVCIFAASILLYRLPLMAVIYPTALCAVTGILFLIFGFLRFKRNHSALESIKKLNADMISSLPEPSGELDGDYHEIVALLRDEAVHLEDSFDEKYRDMTEYYSVWAHQIKTPIASMKLTLQGVDSPEARKLSSELMRVERYVEMVLAFIRLDSASTDYVFREYAVDGIIKQTIRRFASDFIGKKLRLEFEPVNKSIVTDEKWFAFVLEQVLSNAIKYTKEGGVKIYLTDGDYLCVEDTGIGVAEGDLPRIFEKGYTGFNGRADKSASGIGLYLCRRVCDNLGLNIKAESELGKGTRILIDLKQNTNRPE